MDAAEASIDRPSLFEDERQQVWAAVRRVNNLHGTVAGGAGAGQVTDPEEMTDEYDTAEIAQNRFGELKVVVKQKDKAIQSLVDDAEELGR
ncbi:hypothetical protein PHISCL_00159 [Aspergillus sclerotialis]|uniref:Uncharacterized protein n=1 Tax=Aspergillus sclerotialis TaxID=2070753 RepID=A0A3A2ZYZ9_9EURO|nr:hypothetical protein PHISCL_00159 [Aspergillus sclerotialis]